MQAEEQVILVDENDNQIGIQEKMAAHENAELHRAFSVFAFRKVKEDLEVLIHQRNPEKYHCGGLWTNTCCSHPRPGEDTIDAGKRRLVEEMGFNIELIHFGSFIYKAEFDNGLTEYELDHVLVGKYSNETIAPSSEEVFDYKWVKLDWLENDLVENSDVYTPWISLALEVILKDRVKLERIL